MATQEIPMLVAFFMDSPYDWGYKMKRKDNIAGAFKDRTINYPRHVIPIRTLGCAMYILSSFPGGSVWEGAACSTGCSISAATATTTTNGRGSETPAGGGKTSWDGCNTKLGSHQGVAG